MIKNIERTKDGMDSLIDRTRDAVVGATDRAERGVESAAERVVEKTHLAGEHVRDGAKTASRDAHRRLESAAKAVDRGYTKARGDLLRAATTATDYVTENPGKAMLVAASSGFVIGMLVSRRRCSSD
jgi:ElaB/YqjD/DUF883 family membrane-anchored ribosome-binding protein